MKHCLLLLIFLSSSLFGFSENFEELRLNSVRLHNGYYFNLVLSISSDQYYEWFDEDYPNGVVRLRVEMYSEDNSYVSYKNSFLISSLKMIEGVLYMDESLIEQSKFCCLLTENPFILITCDAGYEDVAEKLLFSIENKQQAKELIDFMAKVYTIQPIAAGIDERLLKR